MKPTVVLTNADQRATLAAARGLAAAGYGVTVTGLSRGITWWSRACSAGDLLPDSITGLPFVVAFEDVLRRRRPDAALPGSDQALVALSHWRQRFEPLTRLGLPAHDAVVRSLSKSELRVAAAEAGLTSPPGIVCAEQEHVAAAARELGFPVVLKPDSSVCMRNGYIWRQPARIVGEESELDDALARVGTATVVERWVPAAPVVSCAGVVAEGRLLALATARYDRTWPQLAGNASLSRSIEPPAGLGEAAVDLLGRIGWEGIFELELIELEPGRLAVIDLNPRVYGSLALAIHAGVNIPAIWCDWLLGRHRDAPAAVAVPGAVYRWEEGELMTILLALVRRGPRAALRVANDGGAGARAYFARHDPLPLAAWSVGFAQRSLRKLVRVERRPTTHVGGDVEVITDVAAIERLRPEWDRLAERRGNIFVTPDWVATWLAHYGEGIEPFLTAVRSAGGELLGVLPFVRAGGRLTLAGANLGDIFEPAGESENDRIVAEATAAALAGRRRAWTTLTLHNVEEGAPWVEALVGAPLLRLATVTDQRQVLPTVDLAGLSWTEYLATRSKNLRGQLGRKLRRLEETHDVVFRLASDPDSVSAEMDRFFELHDLRWTSRGGSSIDSPRARAFHKDFAAACARNGRLRLWFLEVDGNAVASWYGWSIGGRYLYGLAGFDPAWSEQSVGLILLARTIQAATEEGASEYDMLLGDEPYKARFATRERFVRTQVAALRFSRVRTLAALDIGLRKAGRALPEPMQDSVRNVASHLLRHLPTARQR